MFYIFRYRLHIKVLMTAESFPPLQYRKHPILITFILFIGLLLPITIQQYSKKSNSTLDITSIKSLNSSVKLLKVERFPYVKGKFSQMGMASFKRGLL